MEVTSKPPLSPAERNKLLLAWVKRWSKRAGVAIAAIVALSIVAFFLVVRHYEEGLPSIDEVKRYHPKQVTRVLARDGTMLGELFVERRTVVPIEVIPNQMKLAVLAAEDASFYEHTGLNYLGIARAVFVNLRSSRARQGGSTITQQVVKNTLLSPERTFDRKMREALLARRIEAELSKDGILELYLNHIYFGHGRYGVEEASQFYFGKSVRSVTLGEAALLAAIIKGPSIYSPRADMERALTRQRFVLAQMVNKGFATEAQAEAARREVIKLAPAAAVMSELAPEVVDEVRRTLKSLVGADADRGGYTITTTIDPALQAEARLAVRRNLDEYAKRKKLVGPIVKGKKEPQPFEGMPSGHHALWGVVTGADDRTGTIEVRVGTATGVIELSDAARYNPGNLPASKFIEVGKVVRVRLAGVHKDAKDDRENEPLEPGDSGASPEPPPPSRKLKLMLELGPEGALVAIDVRTREILALVGSYEGTRGGLDRASHARRQPGSTFKPFVYSYGLHARQLTPATIVETSPSVFGDYKPDNYDEGEGKSPKRVRDALAMSVNVAAVWSLQKLGAGNVAAWAESFGITSKLGADLSLALGSYEVTPREMAGAYASFAAGGVVSKPVLITKITGPNGVEIPLPNRAPPKRVMEENEAYVLTSLLQSVVRSGTATRALALGRPIAGKTGTSNQAKDGWFVGYSPDITCAVWTGYDDPLPMGAGEAGATLALPAFVDFMKTAHQKRPPADFPVPPGVVRVPIDPATGLKASPDQKDALMEVFVAGTEPTDFAAPDAGAPEIDAGAPDSGPPADAPPPF